LLDACVRYIALLLEDIQDCIHDALISGTSTQVAGQFKANACLICVRQAQYDISRGSEHAWSAEPALQRMVAGECRAQQLHYCVVVIALYGRDFLALARHRKGDA
jgi:hypothetical protein